MASYPSAQLLGGQLSLYFAHHQQNDKDYDHEAEAAAWPVTPASAMAPTGQRADQQEYENNKKNGADAHNSILDFVFRFTALVVA